MDEEILKALSEGLSESASQSPEEELEYPWKVYATLCGMLLVTMVAMMIAWWEYRHEVTEYLKAGDGESKSVGLTKTGARAVKQEKVD